MGKSITISKSFPQAPAPEQGADPPTPNLMQQHPPGAPAQCCSTFKQNQGVLIRAEGGIAFHLTKWHHHTVIHLEEIRGADGHVTTGHGTL